jgi:lipid-A-disaccharide synthase
MHIFFSVGEPSGDQHAAHLIVELKRLRPDAKFSGFGGPLMERAGCRLLFPMTTLAVMLIAAVLPLLWKFYKLVRQANRFFRESRPDAVILIDFPGFNWWIARKAKAAGIPVFYYFPPQLWAWAPWRVSKIRKFVDHILCTLPFEKEWYAKRGIAVEYVGHPIFDEIASHPVDEVFSQNWPTQGGMKNVAVLPGSRTREVTHNWPVILEVIRRLHGKVPDSRFLVGCYKEEHRKWCQEQLMHADKELPIHFFVDKTPECIQLSDCCLMVSGSVSLEVLARSKPAVVVYAATRTAWVFYRLIIYCKYLSLPNLMAHRPIMPEFYCAWNRQGDIEKMVGILSDWLTNRENVEKTAAEMRTLRDNVMQPGATTRAAQAILRRLGCDSAREAA